MKCLRRLSAERVPLVVDILDKMVYTIVMKNFMKSTKAFFRPFVHVTIFELLIKLLMTAVGAPFLALILKLTMKAAKLSYLTDENLFVYLRNPVTLLALLIILFCTAFFSLVELSALTGCYACSINKKHMNAVGMFRTGFKAFKKAFRGSGIVNFMLFMLIMPFAQFSIASGIFLAPLMPILQTIFRHISNRAAIAAYILLQILFVILIAGKAYSLHYLVLTDKPFHECVKKSQKTISGEKHKMLMFIFAWSITMLASIAVLTFGISFVAVLFIKGFTKPDAAFHASLKVLAYAGRVVTAVSAFFAAPAVMCMLTGKFLNDTAETEKIKLPDTSKDKKNRKATAAVIAGLLTVALLANFTYLRGVYKGNINLNTGILIPTQITAHRGFSTAAPENTLAAFQAALDSDADYIELDVQLTKDGELVVFHDETIERTTDGKGKISSYTYEELQQFSAGSWFSKDGEFADERIPLLSEVLELCDNDIMLNIEIKRHGNVSAVAEKVVELIQEYDLRKSCYVSSFSYPALKAVKKLDPKIKTALIANLATSTSYAQLKNIDAVSMNYIFVNKSIVNTAHLNGKKVFVWTVDRPSDMHKMITLGVDNIITNRPDTAADVIYSKNIGETILTILNRIFSTS